MIHGIFMNRLQHLNKLEMIKINKNYTKELMLLILLFATAYSLLVSKCGKVWTNDHFPPFVPKSEEAR
ncbi:unnamed protein product, partial [Onchocerca flexuosa]|uniref:Cyclic lactone autoinducer peptide n=1 Tax=Onchocerca flexuosa TaxID=387005 RepID=A0A183HF78_9BILA